MITLHSFGTSPIASVVPFVVAVIVDSRDVLGWSKPTLALHCALNTYQFYTLPASARS